MGRLPGDACRDGDGREAEASLRKLGFHFVRAPIELEGHRSVKLLLIWASFSTEWAAKLMELKSPILLYNKMYFIFRGPFKFGGPVRSHRPHGPKDAPG